MNILETINLWFAMNENGPATDERQLLNDAAEEIERLRAEVERLITALQRIRDHNVCGD